MARILRLQNLSADGKEKVTLSESQLSASRCFGILIACARTMREIEMYHSPEANGEALAGLVASLASAGSAEIEADCLSLAGMIGCKLVVEMHDVRKGPVH